MSFLEDVNDRTLKQVLQCRTFIRSSKRVLFSGLSPTPTRRMIEVGKASHHAMQGNVSAFHPTYMYITQADSCNSIQNKHTSRMMHVAFQQVSGRCIFHVPFQALSSADNRVAGTAILVPLTYSTCAAYHRGEGVAQRQHEVNLQREVRDCGRLLEAAC